MSRSKDALGPRAKIAVLVPSTNTIVQPDFDDLRQALKLAGVKGVTNHVSRIAIPNMDIADDAGFAKLQEIIPRLLSKAEVGVSSGARVDAIDIMTPESKLCPMTCLTGDR